MTARVPDGVSSVEAFSALYNAARVTNRFVDIRWAEHDNLFVDPCSYFTAYWKTFTPSACQQDLQEKFAECERLAHAEKSAKKAIDAQRTI